MALGAFGETVMFLMYNLIQLIGDLFIVGGDGLSHDIEEVGGG
jgi:hypothetical protein